MGSSPNGDMIRDSAGNLYGTTQTGGTGSARNGVVFKMDPSGRVTVLHTFTGGADGGVPFGHLVQDKKDNLYGMTSFGGDPVCLCGTVFKLKTDGTLVVLHTFLGGTDGMQNVGQPGEGLLLVGGELYGETNFGGTPGCDGTLGCGTLFKVSLTGVETVLYRFTGGADGGFPQDLIEDSAGNFYGVFEGGYSSGTVNGGIFKLDASGNYSVIYIFPGGADGDTPRWRLSLGADGTLMGTTITGGNFSCASGNCGVLYSFDTTTGTETVLHAFGAFADDGNEPSGALLDASGNLFGTTYYGGITNSSCPIGCGVLYRLGKTGTYTLLHKFTGGTDGWAPNGAPVQDSKGNLYGAAALGGHNNNGVIFKISH